jgi:ribonuclease VapC
MFVDASALVAIVIEEPNFASYAEALQRSLTSVVTPFVLMEAGLAVMRGRGLMAADAHGEIGTTLDYFRIGTVELTFTMILAALNAYERYGKGRHPARLNMGDCLSYGAARTLGVPLLYKGDDFARTDIASALAR